MTTISNALLTQEALNQARALLHDMVTMIANLQRHGYLTAITATTFADAARQIDEELIDAHPFDFCLPTVASHIFLCHQLSCFILDEDLAQVRSPDETIAQDHPSEGDCCHRSDKLGPVFW